MKTAINWFQPIYLYKPKIITYPLIEWSVQIPSERHALVTDQKTLFQQQELCRHPEAGSSTEEHPKYSFIFKSKMFVSMSFQVSASISLYNFFYVLPEPRLQLQSERASMPWYALWQIDNGFCSHTAVWRTTPFGTTCFTFDFFLSRCSRKCSCPFVILVSLISLSSPALWFVPELSQWPNLFLAQPAKSSSP